MSPDLFTSSTDNDLGDDFSAVSGLEDFEYNDSFNSSRTFDNGANEGSRNVSGNVGETLTMQSPVVEEKWRETSNARNSREGNLLSANSNMFQQTNGIETALQMNNTDFEGHHQICTPSIGEHVGSRNIKPLNVLLADNETSNAARKLKLSSSSLKSEFVAVKARKSSKNILKTSKSDGLLALALKAKYRKSTTRQQLGRYSSNVQEIASSIAMSSLNSGNNWSEMDGLGNEGSMLLGKANASWNNDPTSNVRLNTLIGRDPRLSKPSSMHNLLLQSKVRSRSQTLLRESSAHSLSKRQSLQGINNANKAFDLSYLLPSGGRTKGGHTSRQNTFPTIPGAAFIPAINPMQYNGTDVQSSNADTTNESTDNLLHQACRLFPHSDTVVETALRVDPEAVRRSVVMNSDTEGDISKKANIGTYGYPINLALTHGSNTKILNLLIQSGPDVLAFQDGADCGSSLGILLSSKRCDLALVDLLLSANPKCAQIPNRRGNYPLHIAVSHGKSLQIIKRVYTAYPEAQNRRNFHSQTPTDIAVQSTLCSEEVTDFLRSMTCNTTCAAETKSGTDEGFQHLFEFLEDGLDDIMQTNC
jgi:hypothetical protein